ncbi:Sphingosine-1-phosphate phosphatase 1 [Fukomys damarensis]|uniref:Sphingosine-1-phosphate phosphatase 1 n=1 Tax=Fukomys damarensis TaxID=885580 RepID=A0A091D7J3_FUKDA|nr:Sphingosine-1-phosphate phosphatase 1 [Fukomys damarensis]
MGKQDGGGESHADFGSEEEGARCFNPKENKDYPLLYGLVLIPCWSLLVCLSRIYMGMHSLLDIIAGFLYTILILAVFYPFVDLIDNFNQTHEYAPLIIIGFHLALGIFSFTLDTWSTSRGDTAEILGSGAGIACGSHVTHSMGLLLEPSPDVLPLPTPPITLTVFAKAILRVVIGMGVVLIVRNAMKKITIPLACKIFKIPCDDIRKARQHMEVELPYRYITYGMRTLGLARQWRHLSGSLSPPILGVKEGSQTLDPCRMQAEGISPVLWREYVASLKCWFRVHCAPYSVPSLASSADCNVAPAVTGQATWAEAGSRSLACATPPVPGEKSETELNHEVHDLVTQYRHKQSGALIH